MHCAHSLHQQILLIRWAKKNSRRESWKTKPTNVDAHGHGHGNTAIGVGNFNREATECNWLQKPLHSVPVAGVGVCECVFACTRSVLLTFNENRGLFLYAAAGDKNERRETRRGERSDRPVRLAWWAPMHFASKHPTHNQVLFQIYNKWPVAANAMG